MAIPFGNYDLQLYSRRERRKYRRARLPPSSPALREHRRRARPSSPIREVPLVTRKSGIYSYVLDGDERHLNIRAFTENNKREAYERQSGTCPKCTKNFELGEMEADHITPWREGGKTTAANCQMLCRDDNRI